MSQERKIQWLHSKRVITRCIPWSDEPSEETDIYMYYKHGTHQCYTLFASKAKITTYRSLKWHFLAIYFLNQEYSDDKFLEHVFRFIADKENGFTTFFISKKTLNDIIEDVFAQGGEPPVNKIRKVIFKPPAWHFTLSEKLSIVGRLIGRVKLDKTILYQCMLDINDAGQKITVKRLSSLLGVTPRTIYRHMCDTLKQEKTILNEKL